MSSQQLSLSEAVYQHQIGERTRTMPVQVDRLGAAWPCFFGESVLGDIRSGKGANPDNSTFHDGHKYACGLGMISGDPVVFSFGSHGDQQFETAVLVHRPTSTVRTFDPHRLPSISAQQQLKAAGKVSYHHTGLRSDASSTISSSSGASPKQYSSLAELMRESGHAYIDILKVDVEGAEWGWLDEEAALLLPSRVGQLLVEVHSGSNATRRMHRGFPKRDVRDFARGVEALGLRMFHKEAQWRFGYDCCVELSFIQRDWHAFERDKIRLRPLI